jgi:ABC-type bacteriocin/lantibiotic exporter with double-glycine peptidase domain
MACLISGCAQPDIRRPFLPVSEQKPVLLKVPFFSDHTDQCGPSALASVLGFWGKKAEPGQLKEAVYLAKLKGTLPVDLVLAAQACGMSAKMLDGGMPQLKNELDAGHPLIAFVNLGYRFIPIGHYLVVTGYDDRRQTIYAHSGMKKNGPVSYKTFSKQWERTGRWALLILPGTR